MQKLIIKDKKKIRKGNTKLCKLVISLVFKVLERYTFH